LHHDRLAGLERRLNPLRDPFETARIKVDLAGVQDRVSSLADVNKGRLHGGQHVLHFAQVHVADVRLVSCAVHVMLDQDAVFEDGNLSPIAVLAHRHDSLEGLAPGKEFRFADDRRPTAAGIASLAPALPLGLQAGRTLYRANIVRLGVRTRLSDMDDRVCRLVFGWRLGGRVGRTVALPAPASASARRTALTAGAFLVWGLAFGVAVVLGRVRVPLPRGDPVLRTAAALV